MGNVGNLITKYFTNGQYKMETVNCRLQTGYKMQTRYKMQTDKKNFNLSETW